MYQYKYWYNYHYQYLARTWLMPTIFENVQLHVNLIYKFNKKEYDSELRNTYVMGRDAPSEQADEHADCETDEKQYDGEVQVVRVQLLRQHWPHIRHSARGHGENKLARESNKSHHKTCTIYSNFRL